MLLGLFKAIFTGMEVAEQDTVITINTNRYAPPQPPPDLPKLQKV